MKQLAKFITDERTGLKYELCGDYYIIAGEDEPEREPIGIWGQRHLKHIRKHYKRQKLFLLTHLFLPLCERVSFLRLTFKRISLFICGWTFSSNRVGGTTIVQINIR